MEAPLRSRNTPILNWSVSQMCMYVTGGLCCWPAAPLLGLLLILRSAALTAVTKDRSSCCLSEKLAEDLSSLKVTQACFAIFWMSGVLLPRGILTLKGRKTNGYRCVPGNRPLRTRHPSKKARKSSSVSKFPPRYLC